MLRRKARTRVSGLVVAAALSFTASVALAASDSALIEAAKKEGTVTWASGLVLNQGARPVAAAFEKKYGIDVVITIADNLLLRMTNEARAGKPSIDVFDDGGSAMAALREADLVAPYDSPEASNYRPEHRDPENYWTAYCLFFYTVVINTELVKPEDEPKTYEDLLDPKWKDKMVWQNSENIAGPPSFIANKLITLGETEGMAYLKELSKQNITRIPGNARKALDQVILGQYPLALLSLSHHVVISSAQGAPAKWLKISPVTGTMETVGLVKGAAHPHAAKLFYDFLLSEEGQNVLRSVDYLPAHPNVSAKIPALKPENGNFTAVTMQPSAVQEFLPKWLAIYQRLFVNR